MILESPDFPTKDKVSIHFEADSQNIIAGQFPEPASSGE